MIILNIIMITAAIIIFFLFCWVNLHYCLEWLNFCNFIVPIRFSLKTIEKYIVLLCLYFIIALAIIFLFAFAFVNHDFDTSLFTSFGDALHYSTYVFFSVDSITIYDSLNKIVLYETIAREFLVVILLGNFVAKLTVPANPIFFSRFFTENDGKISFRYWIILPKGKYLYDAKVRVAITDDSEFIKGVNSIESYWEYEQSYDFIRGVRYIELDANEKAKATADVKRKETTNRKLSLKESIDKENATICIIIKGTSEDGQYYNYMKKYKKVDCVYNCKFVSIRKTEFSSKDDAARKRIVTPIRYQHFNCMTVSEEALAAYIHIDSEDGEGRCINLSDFSDLRGKSRLIAQNVSKQILSKDKIEKGTYWANMSKDYFSLILSKICD